MGKNEQTRRADHALAGGIAKFELYDRYGRLKDAWSDRNLIVNGATDGGGLDDYLRGVAKGAPNTSTTNWRLALIQGTTGGITLNSTDEATTVTWTESTDYTEAARPLWNTGAVSGQQVSSTANAATFSINSGTTVSGIALISSSVKGNAGTTDEAGVLHSEIKFSQTRTLSSGDTLDVKYTLTMAFSST